MKLRVRVLLLFGISLFLSLLLALYLYKNSSSQLLEPEDPEKYIHGLKHIPGADKITGSILTHILRPERSERVGIPETERDPGILISVKTATLYHQHRLSLLLFTWMRAVSPQQVYLPLEVQSSCSCLIYFFSYAALYCD